MSWSQRVSDLGQKPIQDYRYGLGDSIRHILHRLGITEKRYKAIKKVFGLPPTCQCQERYEWLNKVSQFLRKSSR